MADIITGLELHLEFEDGSGTTAVDSSGNSNDGNLSGTQGWTSGKCGGGFDFDYTNGEDYFTIPNSSSLENVTEGDYTLTAWFNPGSTPPGTGSDPDANYGILIKTGWHCGLYCGNDGKFHFDHLLTGNQSIGATSTTTFSPGTFYHVAGVLDKAAGTVKIYVNGNLEDTAYFTPGTAARDYGTMTWKVGVANPGGGAWGWASDGTVDDVRIYSRTLDINDIGVLVNLCTPAWLGTWLKRREITIAASDVDDTLTNFPVRVQLSNSAGKTSVDVTDIFDEVLDSWQKIAFTLSDGTTQLYAEVVYWATIGEVAEIWVKVPSLSFVSGGSIYMYYDSAQADNTTYVGNVNSSAGVNVWDGFECVYHMNETSGNYLDSTSNNNHSTAVSVTSRTASGFHGGNSAGFVESNTDNVNLPSIGSWPQSRMVELFSRVDLTDGTYHGATQHRTGTNWLFLGRNGSQIHYRWHDSDTNRRMDYGTLSVGSWHYIAGSLDQPSATAKGYLDGNAPNTVTSAGIPATTATTWYMGYGNSTSESWDGVIDEMRLSTSARSDAWAHATNDTLRDNFTTWGVSESGGYGNTVNTVTSMGKVNGIDTGNISKINTV